MFPLLIPLITTALGAAANAGAGAIGSAAAGSDRDRQRALIDSILKDYSDLDVPELERINPEQMGPSAMEGVQTDPRLRQEQLSVLEKLGNLSQNGNDAESKAAMHQILSQVARQESAGRNAILNNMRARGVSGSGAELAAQLSNQQASAEQAQSAGLQQGAIAQRRMMDALLQRGQMSGQMRNQDFGENSAKAQARDAISRYNADSKSRAGYYNAGLAGQQYQMELQKLNGKAGAARGAAESAGQSASQTANTWAGVGNAANTAATGLAGSMMNSTPSTPGYSPNINPATGEDESIPYYLRKPGGK